MTSPLTDTAGAHPSTVRWYQAHGRAVTDADPDRVYLRLLDSIGRRLGDVDDLVRDSDAGPGWSALLDPDRTPSPSYTGQFVGVRIPGGTSDADARQLLVAQPATRRGSVPALLAAAAMTLTGSRYVGLTERDGSAYRLTVDTYDDETPDPAATKAALEAAKPAGLVLTLRVVAKTSFNALEAEPAQTFDQLEAQAAETFDALEG